MSLSIYMVFKSFWIWTIRIRWGNPKIFFLCIITPFLWRCSKIKYSIRCLNCILYQLYPFFFLQLVFLGFYIIPLNAMNFLKCWEAISLFEINCVPTHIHTNWKHFEKSVNFGLIRFAMSSRTLFNKYS
jgi:hypothetical protein